MGTPQQNKIVVSPVQSKAFNEILRSDDGSKNVDELVEKIVQAAKVERWVAEKLVTSWRYNHPDLNLKTQPEQHAKLFIDSKLFNPDPPKNIIEKKEKGTGIVAQIKGLAAQGKTVQEIIEMGFNKNTVYRRVGEYNKQKRLGK